MKAKNYIVDLGSRENETEIPDEVAYKVKKAREIMVEAIADRDEELMIKYLEGDEITPEELKIALRRAVLDVKLIPVLCGSSFKNKGVQLLLDAIVDFLPSP